MARLKKRISLLGRLRNYFITGIVVLVPIGITLLLPVIITGGLSIHTIVDWQLDHRWLIIHSPFTFIGFLI